MNERLKYNLIKIPFRGWNVFLELLYIIIPQFVYNNTAINLKIPKE